MGPKRRSRFAKLTDPPADDGEARTAREREAPPPLLNRSMKMGLVAVAIGGTLTLVTYLAANANNGTYYVFKGALLVGVILVFRGLTLGALRK